MPVEEDWHPRTTKISAADRVDAEQNEKVFECVEKCFAIFLFLMSNWRKKNDKIYT